MGMMLMLMKTHKKTYKKIRALGIGEEIKKFFPPTSRMGNPAPSNWGQVRSMPSPKTAKFPL